MDRDTATLLLSYLRREIPGDGRDGWDDGACSGHEMALDLLAALGHAELEALRFAHPVPDAQLPAILPRHDDASVALLGLAHQNGEITFREPGAERGARIPSGHGLGAADVADDLMILMERLGLICVGAWTAAAETILWRTWPYEWPEPSFSEDPRVIAAIERSRDIPSDVQQLVDAAMARPEAELRRYYVQHLVYERWRLDDGWISVGPSSPPALCIFHDPLAIQVSRQLFGLSL